MGISYVIACTAVFAFGASIIYIVCSLVRDGIKKILKIKSPSGSEKKKESLFQKYKRLKPYRKQYIIKPKITFSVDKYDYLFSLFPTIIFVPWFSRYPNSYVAEIMWLTFNIGIGLWERNPNYEEETNS